MISTLEEKLLQLCKENFSELQVQAIKEMLEENVNQKKLIENLKVNSKTLTEQKEEIRVLLEKSNKELEIYKSREKELLEHEKKCQETFLKCEERNRNWDKELLQKEVNCLKTIAQNQSDLISDVFSSPVYRSYVDGQHSVIKKDSYGNSLREDLPYHQLIEQRVEASHKHLVDLNNGQVAETMGDKL